MKYTSWILILLIILHGGLSSIIGTPNPANQTTQTQCCCKPAQCYCSANSDKPTCKTSPSETTTAHQSISESRPTITQPVIKNACGLNPFQDMPTISPLTKLYSLITSSPKLTPTPYSKAQENASETYRSYQPKQPIPPPKKNSFS